MVFSPVSGLGHVGVCLGYAAGITHRFAILSGAGTGTLLHEAGRPRSVAQAHELRVRHELIYRSVAMWGYTRSCRLFRPMRVIVCTVMIGEAMVFSAWSYKMTATQRGVMESPVEFAQVKVPRLPRHHKDKTVTRMFIEHDVDELELRARIDLLWQQVTDLESRILNNTSRRVNA